MHRIMGHSVGVLVTSGKDWKEFPTKSYQGKCSCGWVGKSYGTLNMADREALWHALEVIDQAITSLSTGIQMAGNAWPR